jgi:hypothetical protein
MDDLGEAALNMDSMELAGGRRELKTIASIDARLVQWAQWRQEGAGRPGMLGGGNTIAALMAGGGEIVRSTVPQDSTPDDIYDTDRAVTRLADMLQRVVTEHYLHSDATEVTRLMQCGCSRATYYRRLATAHHQVQFMLKRKPSRVRQRG